MATGLADQLAAPGVFAELCFEERLGLLVDKETDARDGRQLARRLKAAKLRYPAAIEDIDWRSPGDWTAPPSPACLSPAGSPPTTTWWSPARPGWASRISPAPSPTLRCGKGTALPMCGFPG